MNAGLGVVAEGRGGAGEGMRICGGSASGRSANAGGVAGEVSSVSSCPCPAAPWRDTRSHGWWKESRGRVSSDFEIAMVDHAKVLGTFKPTPFLKFSFSRPSIPHRTLHNTVLLRRLVSSKFSALL